MIMMNNWTLFLDDIRYPQDVKYAYGDMTRVVICRSMDDAIWAVKTYGLPTFISFDHDLAQEHYIVGQGDKTGYDFAKWLVNHILDNNLEISSDFGFYVHSMNPVGAENIHKYMMNFIATLWKGDARSK